MTPKWFRRTIVEGDAGSDVDIVRRRLGLLPGFYDDVAITIIRGLCSRHGIDSEGTITAEVAEIIGESEANSAGLMPEWFVNHDLRRLAVLVNCPNGDLISAVMRWQGNHGFEPNAIITPEQALLLGE